MPARVKGALELRKALKQFEPDLLKETNKEIASFLKPVVRQARGFLLSNEEAPSGWLKRPNAQGRWATRYYDQAEASRGISYRTSPSKENRRGWVALASITSKNAGGAIYDTAGRKSGIVGRFTPKLGGTLEGNGQKMTGRAMFRAFAKDQGKATAGVVKAIEHAEAKFNGRT
jgi:hypothetical protein